MSVRDDLRLEIQETQAAFHRLLADTPDAEAHEPQVREAIARHG